MNVAGIPITYLLDGLVIIILLTLGYKIFQSAMIVRQPGAVSATGLTNGVRLVIGLGGALLAIGAFYVLYLDLQQPSLHSNHSFATVASGVVIGVGIVVAMLMKGKR
jgi:membrane protease YdiL (CAAX protease family)